MVFGDRSQSLTSLCIPGVLTRFPMCEEQQRGARRIQCPWYSLVTFFGVSPTPRQGQSCRAPLFPCWSMCVWGALAGRGVWQGENDGTSGSHYQPHSLRVHHHPLWMARHPILKGQWAPHSLALHLASRVRMPFPKLMHSKGKPMELAEPHFTASGFGFFFP